MRRVYMDNAATTSLAPEVLEQMMPYLTNIYGNPSSVHSFGREAKAGVDKARQQLAKALNAELDEIIFTGCGTESDNTVLLGVAERYKNKGNHIITTNIEHHAILHTCEYLEKHGCEVTYLPVDENGMGNGGAGKKRHQGQYRTGIRNVCKQRGGNHNAHCRDRQSV